MVVGFDVALGGFAVLAALTFSRYVDAVTVGGDNTPVWKAHCPYSGCDPKLLNDVGHDVKYERLETGAVRRAFDYLHSDEFRGLHGRRTARSLERLLERDDDDFPGQLDDELEHSSGNRTKRRAVGPLLRTKVLAVVQFDASEVTDDASRRKFIHESILYTMAYWRLFNEKVRNNKRTANWSKVGVELVGIIIALNRAATPYLKPTYDAQQSLAISNGYWSHPNDEFPRNAYHAVATLTDVQPSDAHHGFFECVYQGSGGSGTIIVWDNRAFRAPRPHTTLSGFQQVVNTLHWWAQTRPVEVPDYMKPGSEIVIKPGQLITPEEECWRHGYHDLDRLCPEYSKDCEIWCLNKGWFRSCGSIGVALEGTPCVNGKVG